MNPNCFLHSQPRSWIIYSAVFRLQFSLILQGKTLFQQVPSDQSYTEGTRLHYAAMLVPPSSRSVATRLFVLAQAIASSYATPSTAEVMSNSALVTKVYQFGTGTWVENIAVRSNGNLVVVLYDRPEVWEVNPVLKNAEPKILIRFEDATRTTGITQSVADNFIVVVSMQAGDFSVWNLDLTTQLINATKVIASVPDAGSLNGLTTLSPTIALAADTGKGVVHRLDLARGEATVALRDPTMSLPLVGGGINGVRYRAGFLYYTNSLRGILARIPIDATSAYATGPAEILASGLIGIDDFALGDSDGEFFVMDWIRSRILKVTSRGTIEVLATGSDGVAWPTSAQLGTTDADRDMIYVTSSGNPAALVFGKLEGGKILAIKLY